jgi:hypothetical protein
VTTFQVSILAVILNPYPQAMDHRTEYETGNIQAVLDGELDAFMEAYLRQNAWENRMWKKIREAVFTRENFLALMLALILVALVIFTADTTPTWIYQGF